MAVIKVVELVGDSQVSWEDAVKNAVRGAAKSIDNIAGVEIKNLTANVNNGEIVEYKANVKIAFRVKDR
ncbi:MAG: dodecin domain-containing protein [Firmicutes bacterium]|nr:dodecin domain-containing protein [Bacillota bacterium]